jgi:hypothetical protein
MKRVVRDQQIKIYDKGRKSFTWRPWGEAWTRVPPGLGTATAPPRVFMVVTGLP